MLSVTQLGQKNSTVDYDVFRTNGKNSKATIVDSSDPSSLKQHRNNSNGRLLKGVDLKDLKQETVDTKTETEALTTASPPSTELASSHSTEVHVAQNPVVIKDSYVPSYSDTEEIHEENTLDIIPSQIGPDSLHLLKDYIFRLNQKQLVRNADKFPPLSENGLVLIVQTHKREGYLRQLFESMRTVRGIEEVLLVISHDYYYDDMMKLVQTVDFCRVSHNFQ